MTGNLVLLGPAACCPWLRTAIAGYVTLHWSRPDPDTGGSSRGDGVFARSSRSRPPVVHNWFVAGFR